MFKKGLPIVAFLLAWHVGNIATIECDREPASTEGKLLKKLLCGRYDKSQRPVKNDTTVMDIQSSMFVRNYDLYTTQPALSLYVWMTLTWKDEWLTWDRSEFDMEKVMIDSDELWQPTLISYTDKQDGSMKSACTDHMCEVKYNGEVNCIPPCKYGAICKNDIANWPFDIQNCSLIIGTQLEKSTAIRFNNPPKMSTSFEMDHPEWKLLSSNISTGDLSENSNIREAEYIFVLERHVAIYSAILTPGFLLMAISLIVLWMNSSSNERLYIIGATCIGNFSYLEYLYWKVPSRSATVPKMLLFFRNLLVINVFMLIFTIILKQTAAQSNRSERFVDRLVSKMASTSFGRVILQTNEPGNVKEPASTNSPNGNGKGNTTGLMVDAPDYNVQIVSTEEMRVNLANAFMDRIVFTFCLICYISILCSLIPDETNLKK